jgi:hypothetical protein
MHHRQPLAEHVHAGEAAFFKDHRAAFAGVESQPQQHHDAGAEIERMLDELLGELVGRIRHDRFAAVRCLVLEQKSRP